MIVKLCKVHDRLCVSWSPRHGSRGLAQIVMVLCVVYYLGRWSFLVVFYLGTGSWFLVFSAQVDLLSFGLCPAFGPVLSWHWWSSSGSLHYSWTCYYRFWELLAYASQIEILETLVCLILALNVETVLQLDELRQQMPSTVIPIYSMDVRSRLLWLTVILYFQYVIS